MSRFIVFLMALSLWAAQGAAQNAGLARFLDGRIEDRAFGRTDLVLDLSQGVPWRLYTVTEPDRLVLDFAEVDWQGAATADLDRSARVAAVHMGLLRPGWSRMVLELAEPLLVEAAEMQVAADGAGAALHLSLVAADAERFRASAGAPPEPAWAPATAPLPVPEAAEAPLVIVLDPGHGGIDPGAQRGGVNEADLMLTFAYELREALLRAGGYRVLLTREDDRFVSLEARVKFAHDAGADLFVSLHADALAQGIAHGAAVYTLAEEASDAASAALAARHNRSDLLAGLDLSGSDDRVAQVLMDLARLDNTPRSQALAEHLVAGIEGAVGHVHKDPLRQAAFSVLKSADVPSVLVEIGFLSTEEDLKNLQDPAWRARMAEGLRNGIAAWLLEDAALARLRRQ